MIVRANDFAEKYRKDFEGEIENINFDSNGKRKYTGDKDKALNKNIKMMCVIFYGYVLEHGTIPSLDEFCKYTIRESHARAIGDETIEIDNKYGRRYRTTRQKLWDRLHIAIEPFLRECQLLIELSNKNIDCWYDSNMDKDGVDIMCDFDGKKVGIASWVLTSDSVKRKKVKNVIHDDTYGEIKMIDAAILLDGPQSKELKNGVVVYDEGAIAMYAAGIKFYGGEQ